MKSASAATQVRLAETELSRAEHALVESARPWRVRLRKHRNALILGSGFVSGLALTFLPPRWWARIGACAGATAATAARSALTPAIVGAVMGQFRHNGASDASAQAVDAE